MGLFDKLKTGLKKAHASITRHLSGTRLTFDGLEQGLLEADFGVAATTQIIRAVRERCSVDAALNDVFEVAVREIEGLFPDPQRLALAVAPTKPTVVLVVGVNGAGKTTSCAKLAHRLQASGKTVVLGAADTFRAAAIEQLKTWGQRIGCEVVAGAYGADPASIAHASVQKAVESGAHYVLIDTAGRLHNKANLMAELDKVKRVIGKKMEGAPHEVLLTVDGSTGSNALNQAREFHRITPVTGLIVTKLDGTGKGGVVVAIQKELGIPVKFIGLGEQADDLQVFVPGDFARGLFEE
ncbi:MAG: signal recognition particle-docking protein FtsY [Verrucomicrobiae bacterium]|nr:signal recognition particle-docking protein FtsY [Verrucomicrobiae bacterium]